jgi:activator of 2-hydroxyglutaryl-CoA dehydratase
MVNWKLTPRELASLEYKDFLLMSNAYADEERRHNELSRINAAHTAWLLGADAGSTFGKFLEKWGVVEKRVISTGKIDTKALYDKADRITEQLKLKGLV